MQLTTTCRDCEDVAITFCFRHCMVSLLSYKYSVTPAIGFIEQKEIVMQVNMKVLRLCIIDYYYYYLKGARRSINAHN